MPAEAVEGRRLAKSNPHQRTMFRTQRRARMSPDLERIRQAASRDRKMQFTALFHHVYRLETLRRAYFSLNPKAAAGVDGVTWQQYGEDLETNLQDLAERLKRGAYRAQPTRRTYIPKANGRQRPLGVTALEDKIVQAALVEVLNAIYDVDFLGFSYGCRPGSSPHDALDALAVGIVRSKVNWVLNVDICGFFDVMIHRWLVEFIPLKPLAATGSSAPGRCAGHSRVPSPDHGPLLPQAESVLHDAAAPDTPVDVLDAQLPLVERLVRPLLLPRERLAAGFLGMVI
jgi:hypothetical protein